VTLTLDRLSLNQATVKYADLGEAIEVCVANGITGIGLWRDRVDEVGVESAFQMIAAAGLHVSSLCRGGFLTAADHDQFAAAIKDNIEAIETSAALEADTLILVCGGIPAGSSLVAARSRVADGLDAIADRARQLGVQLAIEPLHPMFAADRCVVSTLDQALDLAEPFPVDVVGVVVDTYHIWWDPRLESAIHRAGDRIASFQLCDWVVPLPADMLLGRGHLGDGSIDFGPIAAAVEQAGYSGYVEVEIFNADVWSAPAAVTARIVGDRFAALT